ncbi:MAG: transglycosylase SLT domain-containing protein [Syntrophaceae bacterium]|nr:transglycosylase SLT domain-containing protein [Syntrophaceae bacterium]
MFHKILGVGMILFLSSACFPHLGRLSETTYSYPSLKTEGSSLFTKFEIEKFFSQKEEAILLSVSSLGNRGVWMLGIPISDESNDEVQVELIPKDRPKQPKEFDIPIVINAKVEQFIQYFQTTARKAFSTWLSRSERYMTMMRSLLKENGLPEDLVYLALIESGFNPYAYSKSKASGLWQFIYPTGKRYGLRADWWIDERRDPEKSTIAAAKYLRDLFDLFDCWYLAAAGYNAGEAKIVKAMKRYRTEDFWELTKYRYLKRETKDYVPQMIAAALIAKDPGTYGFVSVDYEEPLHYEKVRVPEVTDLRLIAQACEVGLEEIKALNPELSRWCTPPNFPNYEIKIPYGKKELFLRNFELLCSGEKFLFKTHTVKKGETLLKIAQLYRIDLEPILELNRLNRKSRLSTGMNLLIPLPRGREIKPNSMAMIKSAQSEKCL